MLVLVGLVSRNIEIETPLEILLQDFAGCIERLPIGVFPQDVMFEATLATVTHDLMVSLEEIPPHQAGFSGNLRRYLQYGFLVPRYRVRHQVRGRTRREDVSFYAEKTFHYTEEGTLQKITFETLQEKAGVDIASLSSYRSVGLLVEDPHAISPRSKDIKNLTPVFAFSQVAQLRQIHRFLSSGFVNISLLFFTPEDFFPLRPTQ